MSDKEFSAGAWPPKGWEQFKDIELLSNQVIHKDPLSSTVTGLCYNVEPIPVYKKQKRTYIYSVSIEGWEYSINNDSREVPILSFLLGETKPMPMARELVIENIKSYSRAMKSNAKSSHRALTAAIYFMRQINMGNMPDIDESLKLFKLHPSQKEKSTPVKVRNIKGFSVGSALDKEEKAG